MGVDNLSEVWVIQCAVHNNLNLTTLIPVQVTYPLVDSFKSLKSAYLAVAVARRATVIGGARLKEGTGSYSDLLGRAKWPGCLGRQGRADETSKI